MRGLLRRLAGLVFSVLTVPGDARFLVPGLGFMGDKVRAGDKRAGDENICDVYPGGVNGDIVGAMGVCGCSW